MTEHPPRGEYCGACDNRVVRLNHLPTFGERLADVDYKYRAAAYAVILGEGGRVAIVQEEPGLFLPGGGSKNRETAVETLLREVREECGRRISISRRIGEAIQYYSPRLHVQGHATFFQATFVSAQLSEGECQLFWLPPEEAVAQLHLEYHVWAVQQALLA